MSVHTLAVVSLVISGLALFFSAVSLGWNIYRELILKARVTVSLSVITILAPGMTPGLSMWKISISVLNLGPGEIIISGPTTQTTKKARRSGSARGYYIVPEFIPGISQQLPATLKRGERVIMLIPFTEDCFLKGNDVAKAGATDSFFREHFAPKKDLKRARAEYRRTFGKAS